MTDWRPSCDIDALKARAKLLSRIRDFFQQRNVLEVETPLLMRASAAEPHLHNYQLGDYALQTSPESAMKRLLAANVGPIFQICKAFRADEQGPKHNPEFTMLEWYRPGFSFEATVQEALSIVELGVGEPLVRRYTYAELFEQHFSADAHAISDEELARLASEHIDGQFSDMSRAAWLDLLMSHVIEPALDPESITVIENFPACQAALAKTLEDDNGNVIARRFEIYFAGLELANGYDELIDPVAMSDALAGADSALLAATASGLPASCGVALGLDRLLMASLKIPQISDVLSFDFSRV